MEQTQSFNNVLRVRYDAIKAMQRQARKFLRQEFDMFNTRVKLNSIPERNTYFLSARGGGKESPYGIIVGEGSPDQLSSGLYKELQMAYSLLPLVSVLKNSIQSVTGFSYTSKNAFYFRYPWQDYQEIKFPRYLYKKEYYVRATPDHNREDKVFWTDVFMSPMDKELMITVAAPVYRNMEYKGVVSLDFTLSSVDFFVESLHHRLGNFLVINEQNTVIADLALGENTTQSILHLENVIPDDLPLESISKVSEASLTRIGGYWVYVAHTSFAPWQIIYYVNNKDITIQTIKNILPSLLMVILFTTLFMLLANRLITREFIRPAGLLVRHIEKRGTLDQVLYDGVSEPWKPWFSAISNVFLDNKMLVDKLEKHIDKLDDQVAKRTKDLSKQNKLLEKTLEDLKTAQSQIIIQEKLAGLGSLTAGIAHEIRNPLNFIVNFADNSKVFGEEIFEALENASDRLTQEEYESIKDLSMHLLKNMKRIEDHGRRADAIVNSMLTHAHGGNDSLQTVNIHDLIDENILLGLASFKQKGFQPKVTKKYKAKDCDLSVYPQDLGRVFLNIINNACFVIFEKKQACDAQNKDYKPEITVKTEEDDHFFCIRIRDNGSGIPAHVKKKIFDPFFTTKPTGQGTGLGLSLSYEIIVKQHNGKMDLDTKANQYTEFIIRVSKTLQDVKPVDETENTVKD